MKQPTFKGEPRTGEGEKEKNPTGPDQTEIITVRRPVGKRLIVFLALGLLFLACGEDCVDECNSGESQCGEGGYQICGDYDSDSCSEWSEVIACGEGENCVNGHCVTVGCSGDEYIEIGSYHIARYEASRPDATATDAGSDSSKACSRPGVLPWGGVNWDEARAACEAAGARLCRGDEWGDACDGTEGEGGLTHPYGNNYDCLRCNGNDAGNGRAVPTGSMTGCLSGFEVYDLSGNVWEWTEETCGKNCQILRGGSFGSNYGERLECGYEFGIHPGSTYSYFGFRCCY